MHVRLPREGIARALSLILAMAVALVAGSPEGLAYGKAERLGGKDRYETMSLIVGRAFEVCDWAVVASAENYPDALTASALAGVRKCPVILTSPSALSPQASAELARLQVKNAYIMGGASAVSPAVEREVSALGIACTRVAGANRQETSLKALGAVLEAGAAPDTVVVATGLGFADALSIAPWAWASASPVVLAGEGGTLPPAAADAIRGCSSVRRVLIVGGPAAVSDAVKDQLGDAFAYERLAGADRFATSVEVAAWACSHGLGWESPAVATGSSFADALSAAPMLGKQASPLLLASDAATRALRAHASEVGSVTVLGGEAAVSAAQALSVADAVASPASTSTSTSTYTSTHPSTGGGSHVASFGPTWTGATTYGPRSDGGRDLPTPTPAPSADDDGIAPMEDPSIVDAPVDLWPDEEDVEISGNGKAGRESQFFFAETAKGSEAPVLHYYADNDYDDELVELDEQTGAAPAVAQAEASAGTAQAQEVGPMAPLSETETKNLDARYDDIDPTTHDYWKVEFKGLPADEQTLAFFAVAGGTRSETVHCDYWLPFDADEQVRIKSVDDRMRALMGEGFDPECPYDCDYWLNHTEQERHDLAAALLDELKGAGYIEDVVDEAEAGRLTFAYVNDVTDPEDDERGIIGAIEYGDVVLEGLEVPLDAELGETDDGGSGGTAAPELALDWEDYTSALQPMGEALRAQAQVKGNVLMINGFPRFERDVKQRLWWKSLYTRIRPTWANMGYAVTLWDQNITVHAYKQLAGREFVVLGTHGSSHRYPAGPRNRRRYYTVPTLCVSQFWNDQAYTRELKDHQIIKTACGYDILPRFFTANYRKHAFRNANFFFDACSTLGRNNAYDYSMARAVCDRGAVSAVGFCNTVRSDYAKATLAEYGKNLLSGMTVGNAFRRTQSVVGRTFSEFYYRKFKKNFRPDATHKYDCFFTMYGYDRGGIKYFYRR